MIDIGFFYLLLLTVMILIVFIILLYSGFHTRILAPAIMNANYGLSFENGAPISGVFSKLYLNDGVSVVASGGSGGVDFGTQGSSGVVFEFLPLTNDRNRNISGKITIYGYSSLSTDQGTPIQLYIIDEGDNNKKVSDISDYNFKGFDYGLQKFELLFNSGSINDSDTTHKFVLQGKSKNDGTIPNNRLLINSAHLSYY